MPTKTIICPSGLTGEIRNLKAKEMSILADPAARQRLSRGHGKGKTLSHPLDPIFEGCWLNTIDPGPYAIPVGDRVPWPKTLVCDRFYSLIHIRDLTWGAYEFKVKCPNTECPRHKKGFLWELDLNQLEYKPLPPASISKVAQGDRVFEFTLNGATCHFRLLTGEDEANSPGLGEDVPSHKKLLAQVAARIFRVSDVEDGDDEARTNWVGELDLADLYAASKAMDAVDGGVETRTKVECPDCEEVFTTDIPFADAAFLTPTRT